ncbi:uncharacterized protein KY384_007832 [Bacidia gigantensis]|uniref:uncharacterized protein n=1 Tax=Bacidia gigantensis TaxID=2732470 RepID=UPI001D0491EA|nr:uncharacterized protein KY384_007832 [Bacidia gigantensis]KAG8527679.1 hypothetical protein KY384_007832 [Bacidia gigantensis]
MSLSIFIHFCLLFLVPVNALFGHEQAPLSSDEADWATLHMAEEHHIANLDPASFFTLHDYDSNGLWSKEEVRRTYGLDDESTKEVTKEKKDEVVKTVIDIFDKDGDGVVSRDEWMKGWRDEGKRLPDFGTGPGHHGDDEYEYEIHHFEKYHDENTKEEDLTHPEDIEHFRKHDEMDAAAERQAMLDRMQIVEQNIPQKFRRY